MTPSSGSQGMTALLQSKNLMLQSKNPSLLFDQGEGISCASQTVKTVWHKKFTHFKNNMGVYNSPDILTEAQVSF